MYQSTADHLFARVAQITARAAQLLQGGDAPPAPTPSTEAEALSLAAGVELRLPQLAATFDLPPLAVDLLCCLFAVEYEPLLRTLQRALQRELGRPWLEVGTAAELLGLPARRLPELSRLLRADAPLRRFGLVRSDDAGEVPLVSLRLKLTPRVAAHLLGDDQQDPPLRLSPPGRAQGDTLVPTEATAAALASIAQARRDGEPRLIELAGPAQSGKTHLAAVLAAALGRPLLCLDLAAVPRGQLAVALADLWRETRLQGALPCLQHLDAVVLGGLPLPGGEDPERPAPGGPRRLPDELLAVLDGPGLAALGGPLLVTTQEREALLARLGVTLWHVAVPFPSPAQRAALMDQALRAAGVPADQRDADVDLLGVTRRFALDPGATQAAAREAAARARLRDPAAPRVNAEDLRRASQHLLRHDLKSLAVRVTANHRWEDLVIPEDVYNGLMEMVAYVRHGALVYEQWGFGARHSLPGGVSALFAGPPGTGKTMCASVMARELDMELFRVDLSRVVSKWIGETEKNLARVFDEAQRSGAIILFDEADALFAKRTEVKSSVDRYANLEVNFLLQRMEAFGGVTILTTNFEDTLDTAFKRRLTFRLRFEKPTSDARAALWRKAFPPGCALAEDVDPDRLGQRFEMSGGNIRNAALRAAFLAAERGGVVDMAACLIAAEREAREMGLLTYEAQLQLAEELASLPVAHPVHVVTAAPLREAPAWPWSREAHEALEATAKAKP